ncbi:DUF6206 family protein [Rhodobacteraceae bacterium N5(2021)]|uniref:DUF6206 family protein n=1 Tax=Gymnodinialimonas phycosphaerae TaxID=2841589 RepID=A0A975YEB4_9RHOB|nr:DUF6206 family protein [Gymnodinialimonas phycosphaerae]MBY4893393.1 DUF6206 family protein [Gymnodinialimonas phycosphaerae]
MIDLSRNIRATLADGTVVPHEKRYFGVPLRPRSGPLEGYLVTAYRGGRDPEVQELLARRHDAYVDCLQLAGMRVPETHLRLIDEAGMQRPVIVQKAVPDDMMLVPLIRKAGPKAAIGLLDRVATDVAEFWRRVAQRPERVGLHAQIERFAMDETGPLFLDTFPPLIAYSRNEMGQLIQRFADNGLLRGLGKVLPGRLRDMQDRWYTPAGSIQTLIEGALRQRPNDAEEILEWADKFAATRLEGPWRNAVQAQLARHARAAKLGVGRWNGIAGRDRPHA